MRTTSETLQQKRWHLAQRVGGLALLALHMGLCGCLTAGLWDSGRPTRRSTLLCDINATGFSVQVLAADRIAILPAKGEGDRMKKFATIYSFQSNTYTDIKGSIEKVNINETFHLVGESKWVDRQEAVFIITLNDGRVLPLNYLESTMTSRSEKELHFEDERISFVRKISADKTNIDLSWLYKIPLTPVALGADIAMCAVILVLLPFAM